MSKLETPGDREIQKSPLRNKVLAAVMAAIGGLGSADCAITMSHVSVPGGRVTLQNGNLEACSKDPNYVQQFRRSCKEGTIRVTEEGGETCLRCEDK